MEKLYMNISEGEYDHTENAIRQLLGLASLVAKDDGQDLSKIHSPEMYFKLNRIQHLSPEQKPSTQSDSYKFPTNLPLNNFAVEGKWKFNNDFAELTNKPGKIRLHF